MKIFFCSFMFPDVENNIRQSKCAFPVSGHKFQENLLRGIVENHADVTVINCPRIRRYPDYPKIIWNKEKETILGSTEMIHVGFLNLFAINWITQSLSLFRQLKKMIEEMEDEHIILLTFNSTIQIAVAMFMIKKCCPNVHTCAVIGDLHGQYGIQEKGKGLFNLIRRKIGLAQDWISSQFDSFGFLTKFMAEALCVQEKPYVVLEGFYSGMEEENSETKSVENEEKTIFYAGSLCSEYGIKHLLSAFSLIDDADYRLIIAGNGDMEEYVKECSSKDHRITFLGFISPSNVVEYQQKATVLISPRTSEHTYVKYSFASKAMECLASGKPYIAHKLPCDPPEYSKYIQYVENDSDQALRDKIVELCELSKEDWNLIGKNAQRFIAEEKNPRVMCKRIIDMLNEIQ